LKPAHVPELDPELELPVDVVALLDVAPLEEEEVVPVDVLLPLVVVGPVPLPPPIPPVPPPVEALFPPPHDIAANASATDPTANRVCFPSMERCSHADVPFGNHPDPLSGKRAWAARWVTLEG
jgi:hypothetical protein